MDENKSGLYIVAIVGLIAIIALVVMVMHSRNSERIVSVSDSTESPTATSNVIGDSVGQAAAKPKELPCKGTPGLICWIASLFS